MPQLAGTFLKIIVNLLSLFNRFLEFQQLSTKSAHLDYLNWAKILPLHKIKCLRSDVKIKYFISQPDF